MNNPSPGISNIKFGFSLLNQKKPNILDTVNMALDKIQTIIILLSVLEK